MKQKRRCEFQKERPARLAKLSVQPEKRGEPLSWPGERVRYLPVIGIALIALSILIIYGQTIRVPPIDYEDSFYLVHSPYVDVSAAFSSLGAVWSEPYFTPVPLARSAPAFVSKAIPIFSATSWTASSAAKTF
jgi:hypothetical protein